MGRHHLPVTYVETRTSLVYILVLMASRFYITGEKILNQFLPFLLTFRDKSACQNGSRPIDGQMGRVRWAARKTAVKNMIRTRNDTVGLVSVPARHGRSVVRGPKPQRTVPTQHDTDNRSARA